MSSFTLRTRALLALASTGLLAQSSPDRLAIPDDTKDARWVLSLAPKAFQKNPQLDFNVITEMTGEGRKRPRPSSAQPATFVAQSGKYLALGDGVAPTLLPPVEKLQEIMIRALAVNHFLPAIEGGPTPDLVVVFSYGAHSVNDEDPLAELERANAEAEAIAAGEDPQPTPANGVKGSEELLGRALSDLTFRKDLLERAALIGGTPFANELAAVIAEQVTHARSAGALGLSSGLGPFQRFRERDSRTRHLVEESFSSCYFVIATAYDYASVARNDRIPLWRTRMTVNSAGVNMTESLPPLIAAAAPFLGREMPHAAVMTRRIDRSGTVTIGEATVIGVEPSPPSASGRPGSR
ncbi:MAG TPA: hypothetical protein VGD88_07040 [Opitutaceae bacterium]